MIMPPIEYDPDAVIAQVAVTSYLDDTQEDMARRSRVPTNIQRAIEEGYRSTTAMPAANAPSATPIAMRAQERRTELGTAAAAPVVADEETSVPTGISQEDEWRYRLRKIDENMVDLARGIGDVHNRMRAELADKIEQMRIDLGEKLERIATVAELEEQREARKEQAELARATAEIDMAGAAARANAEAIAKRSESAAAIEQDRIKAAKDVKVAGYSFATKVAIALIGVLSTVIAALVGHAVK